MKNSRPAIKFLKFQILFFTIKIQVADEKKLF